MSLSLPVVFAKRVIFINVATVEV